MIESAKRPVNMEIQDLFAKATLSSVQTSFSPNSQRKRGDEEAAEKWGESDCETEEELISTVPTATTKRARVKFWLRNAFLAGLHHGRLKSRVREEKLVEALRHLEAIASALHLKILTFTSAAAMRIVIIAGPDFSGGR